MRQFFFVDFYNMKLSSSTENLEKYISSKNWNKTEHQDGTSKRDIRVSKNWNIGISKTDYGQKSKLPSKIEHQSFKNRFRRKSKFSSKNKIFVKKSKFRNFLTRHDVHILTTTYLRRPNRNKVRQHLLHHMSSYQGCPSPGFSNFAGPGGLPVGNFAV